MMPLFRDMRLMLESADLKATIDFYQNILGFSLTGIHEEEGITDWIQLTKDAVNICFKPRNLHTNQGIGLSGNLYFYPDDIDAMWHHVKDKCKIVYPIENFEYGMREFGLEDNNGYVLSFGKSFTEKSEYDRFFPATMQLETPRVILRLLEPSDAEALSAIAQSDDIWQYFSTKNSSSDAMAAFIKLAIDERVQGKRMPFVIIEKESNRICGSTSFGNISFFDKRVEIGWSWLGTEFMGTGINKHAKFALMSYAFEAMNMERVEIKTDNLNERAKAALVKIGARPEGILRSHMQMHSDRRRDSIYFSVLKNEWELVKEARFSELA